MDTDTKRKCIKVLLRLFCAILLLLLCVNYFTTNNSINNNCRKALSTIENIDTLLSSQKLDNYQQDLLIKIEDKVKLLKSISSEIEYNRKWIFDSNVITFLISFFLVVFIYMEQEKSNKTKNYYEITKEFREKIEKVEQESQTAISNMKHLYEIDKLINELRMIKLISISLNLELLKSKLDLNGSLNEYARLISLDIDGIINDMNRCEYTVLPQIEYLIISRLLNQIEALTSCDNIRDKNVNNNQLIIVVSMHEKLATLINRINLIPKKA